MVKNVHYILVIKSPHISDNSAWTSTEKYFKVPTSSIVLVSLRSFRVHLYFANFPILHGFQTKHLEILGCSVIPQSSTKLQINRPSMYRPSNVRAAKFTHNDVCTTITAFLTVSPVLEIFATRFDECRCNLLFRNKRGSCEFSLTRFFNYLRDADICRVESVVIFHIKIWDTVNIDYLCNQDSL